MAAEEPTVIRVHNVDDWNKHLAAGNESKKLIVVDFTASWCGPCHFITLLLTEWGKKYHIVIFLKVDVDELKTVATDWVVKTMPTLMFPKEGKIVNKVVGAKKDEILTTINKHTTV